MDKREFLKTSGALFASSFLPKLTTTQTTARAAQTGPGTTPTARRILIRRIPSKTSSVLSTIILISKLSGRATPSMALPIVRKTRYR